MKIKRLVESICNLQTRKFGDVGEILMTKVIDNLEKADDSSYDKKLEKSKKGEIKTSRAFCKSEPLTEDNVCEVLMQDNTVKLIDDSNKLEQIWDCNIQQVKPKCFDVLWYNIFFRDVIYIFEISSDEIITDSNLNYSGKQHRGNVGEGQFHVNNKKIQYHIDNYLYAKITYNELWELLNEESRTV